MNELSNIGKKRMTVQEVAEALNVNPSTVVRHARDMGLTRNGRGTLLSEAEATMIKIRIQQSGRTDLGNVADLQNVHTDLEIAEMTLTVIAHHKAVADELRARLAAAAPKLEAHDALMTSDNTLTITNASKHFGLHPRREVFPYLMASGYLTRAKLPTQAAIDAGYLRLCEERCHDDEVRPVARVPVASLDIWRLRVVPQVKKWLEKA